MGLTQVKMLEIYLDTLFGNQHIVHLASDMETDVIANPLATTTTLPKMLLLFKVTCL